MMRLFIAILFASLIAAPQSSAEEQKKVFIINATPYTLVQAYIWYAPHRVHAETYYRRGDDVVSARLETGNIAPHTAVIAYVAKKACIIHLAAFLSNGDVFSQDIDTCHSVSAWSIRTSLRI